jgi:hypothetical protein
MVPTHASLFPLKLTLLPDTLPEKAPEEQARLMEQPCCVTIQVPAEQLPVVGQVPAMLSQLSLPQDAATTGSVNRKANDSSRFMVLSLAIALVGDQDPVPHDVEFGEGAFPECRLIAYSTIRYAASGLGANAEE